MTNHRDCDHPATKAARAKCRKARTEAAAKVDTAALELISYIDSRPNFGGIDWVLRGAGAFGSYQGEDRTEAARALLDYFGPSGDEDEDRSRIRNGYTITTSPSTIFSIICRRFS